MTNNERTTIIQALEHAMEYKHHQTKAQRMMATLKSQGLLNNKLFQEMVQKEIDQGEEHIKTAKELLSPLRLGGILPLVS